MGGYMLSGFNKTLVLTGALNKGASARIAETGKWWIDCTETDGMRRGGPGYKSTLHVRLVHALVRRNLQKRPDWDSQRMGPAGQPGGHDRHLPRLLRGDAGRDCACWASRSRRASRRR
jgi:hypothetical protein